MRLTIPLAGVLLLVLIVAGVGSVPDAGRLGSALSEDDPPQPVGTRRPDARERQEDEARKKLAFESLSARLPKGRPVAPLKPLGAESKKRWEILDRYLAASQDRRAKLLKALHERTRKFFVESPGFGAERTLRPFRPEDILFDTVLMHGDRRQPGKPADFPLSPGEDLSRVEPTEEFHFYHDASEFLHPAGFGYVKDRDHVAGFSAHGYRYLGVPVHESKRWRVHHVLLVGILSQERPVVYLTDQLPSMEQIRRGKTRALDYFEEAALSSLYDGEDLYIARKGNTIRMLGALRATRACQQCHDAEVGDLLGALSYTLRPAPKGTGQLR